MNTMSFSRKRWLWWLSLLVRLLLLPTSWTTQALQERALQPHVVYRKHSTTIRHPLRMSMQEKGTIGATVAYEDDQSGTSVRCQNTRETGQESGVVKEQQRSSTRAVDLKFTSTLLTHYENKLVYTLNDGTSLTLRRLQYLDEVQDCALFTVKTFFDETTSVVGVESNKEKFSRFVDKMNPFRANNLKQLSEIQIKELANRLDHPFAAMFMIENTTEGDIVGFSEIFTQPFDQETMRFKDPLPAALTNKEKLFEVSQPKIANFCVNQDYRKQGIGKLLLSACLSQACEWGYEQALLLVDADNASARKFYRYQGFADVAYESGMRKYDVNTMRLSSVRSPKYLMQKPLA